MSEQEVEVVPRKSATAFAMDKLKTGHLSFTWFELIIVCPHMWWEIAGLSFLLGYLNDGGAAGCTFDVAPLRVCAIEGENRTICITVLQLVQAVDWIPLQVLVAVKDQQGLIIINQLACQHRSTGGTFGYAVNWNYVGTRGD